MHQTSLDKHLLEQNIERNRDYEAIATMSLPDWKVNKAVMRYTNGLKEKGLYGL